MALLEVSDLSVTFPGPQGPVEAVRGVTFSVAAGETHCIVGESGCGKSVTSLAIMGLISSPGKISAGSILFDGDELLKKSESELRSLRGSKIAMIFQDPMNSLNPVYRCGDQVAEAIQLHKGVSKDEAYKAAVELFRDVKIPDPEKRVMEYPHELSGGMRQRVMIAMALACEPDLLIADEPTTALDVTVQAQILQLLKELQIKHTMAVLFITHDLGVVAQIADRVTVLYSGLVAESAPVAKLFENPLHPYTKGLMNAIPHLTNKKVRLEAIDGTVPELGDIIDGCRFADRCSIASDVCFQKVPPFQEDSEHGVACFHSGREA